MVIKSEKKEYERTALKKERSLCCCMGGDVEIQIMGQKQEI